MNGSMVQTLTSGIAHNIWFAEEKVDLLKSERSMDEDWSWSQSDPFRSPLDEP
jgi:hypothetical protein